MIPMTLDYGVKEVMVVNSRNNTTEYVGLGAKLDGGTIELIHPLGAVTRRENGEELLYPVGKRLVEAVPFEETLALYPEVYYEFRDASEEFKRKKAAEEAAKRANEKKGVKPDQGPGAKKSAPGAPRKSSTPAATRGDLRRPVLGANRGRVGPRRGAKSVTGPRAGGTKTGQPASAAKKKSESSGG